MGILIFKGLTARSIYKSFGAEGLSELVTICTNYSNIKRVGFAHPILVYSSLFYSLGIRSGCFPKMFTDPLMRVYTLSRDWYYVLCRQNVCYRGMSSP
jgi:hypothetical protein